MVIFKGVFRIGIENKIRPVPHLEIVCIFSILIRKVPENFFSGTAL
jgi:hypothetical protein